ncbi:MAG: glycosyltransferase family 2 protein [Clostridia bacterium]|nr:glycosyltransferase family 2 protein [Clostridia bacterium]
MISIVIPVYNAALFLPDMLDSIINQSYKQIEIILVNDGSTDNSSSICHEYAKLYDYITVYDRQNHGVSASRNFGVKKALGEFIWFMDSDDILEKDALLNAIEAQMTYDADIVIGGMNFCFTEENKIISKKISTVLIFNSHEFKHQYKELFSSNYISSLCNKLIRRTTIVENNIYMNESLSMYEDYVFCMDALLKCRTVVCLPQIFYNYQLRNTKSLSHRYKENIINMFCILEKKISEYKKVGGDENNSANIELDNLLVYIAYESIKNESRSKNPYLNIRKILRDEQFHNAIMNYKGNGKKYRIVHWMMKKKMALPLLTYIMINKKNR